MKSFLENYSDDKLSNALNIVKKFKETVKYFKYKPVSLFGDKVCIYKLISVEEDNSRKKCVRINYVGVEILEPYDDYEFPTLKYGPKTSIFELTKLDDFGFETTNLTGCFGINELMDFFNSVEVIDESEAKKFIKKFKEMSINQLEYL